ncbi:MAG: DCL family protein [Bacteroidetes bacterium]|nr:DCL family protein [Bacteroidota bacterium]MCL2301645.1 DCL family protein [Lentimicrobiaceae bacterium]
MRKKIKIGTKEFATKKEALNHYKTILNSYEFGEFLNDSDFSDILDLLETHPNKEEKIGVGIEKVRVSKLQHYYNTKAFELVRFDGSMVIISYIQRISSPQTSFTKFCKACREAIREDLRNVKLAYFKKTSKKGKVKCQETGELDKYENLTVDHRQPNTFSIIVDRFIELNNLNLENIEYIEVAGDINELADIELKEKFKQYHTEKANLRIVKKKLNLGRSFQARVTRQKKDLIVGNEK